MCLIRSAVALWINVVDLQHVTVAATARCTGCIVGGEDFVAKLAVLDIGHFENSYVSVSIITLSAPIGRVNPSYKKKVK